MNKNELIPFDITEYLSQVLEDGDNDEFIRAIGHIVTNSIFGYTEIIGYLINNIFFIIAHTSHLRRGCDEVERVKNNIIGVFG
jgi:hypothetical protein